MIAATLLAGLVVIAEPVRVAITRPNAAGFVIVAGEYRCKNFKGKWFAGRRTSGPFSRHERITVKQKERASVFDDADDTATLYRSMLQRAEKACLSMGPVV